MFPDGNIIIELSKFGENVPAWELLVERMGLLNKIVPEREYCCQTRGCWNEMRALGNTVSRHSGAAAELPKRV
jgi:hypothetical protein